MSRVFDVLLVGAGGIGAPAALVLGRAGVPSIAVIDDDEVDISNLHRQILFSDADVGKPKLECFVGALRDRFAHLRVEAIHGRALPESARGLVSRCAVVIDATDNFASRFLLADACFLEGVPIVHAAAIQWRATVLATSPRGAPCYRCLFEDLPEGVAPACSTAGVVGPVCAIAGAVAADRALRLLSDDASVLGRLVTYDGHSDALREVNVHARAGCALCGGGAWIRSIDASRYVHEACSSEQREKPLA